MTVAPSSRWRPWIAERLAGSKGRPASAPIGTACQGGRAVVVPTCSRLWPVSCGHQPHRRQLAHAALAGAHRRGRVALGQLDRVVALLDREVDVLRGHVLAQAGEALALAPARSPGAARRPRAAAPRGRGVGRRSPTLAESERRGRGSARGRAGALGVGELAGARDLAGGVDVVGQLARARSGRARGRRRCARRTGSAATSPARCRPTPRAGRSRRRARPPRRPACRPPRPARGRGRAPRARSSRAAGAPRAASARSAPGVPPFSRRSATAASSTPGVVQRRGCLQPAVADRRHDGALARARLRSSAASRRAPPDSITPGRSLPGNTQRLLDRAGRVDDRGRARTWCSVSPCQTGTRPSKQPERGRAREHLDARPRAPARPARARARGRPRRAGAPPGSGPSSQSTTSAPCSAAAIAALSPAAPPPTTSTSAWRRRYSVRHSRSGWLRGEPAEPGGVAQHLLVERPEAPRPDERLVVEAGRRERAAELVGRPHHVEARATARRSCARPSCPRAAARCRRARRARRRPPPGSSGTGRRSRAARAGGGT